MKQNFFAILIAVVLATSASMGRTAMAEQPTYLVLRAPPAYTTDPTAASRCGAHVVPVTARPYAYGWFGAAPRQHWSRHFGYYRNYTQWSAK